MTEQKVIAIDSMSTGEIADYLNTILKEKGDGKWYVYQSDITWIEFVSNDGYNYMKGFGIVIFEKFNPEYKLVRELKKDDLDKQT